MEHVSLWHANPNLPSNCSTAPTTLLLCFTRSTNYWLCLLVKRSVDLLAHPVALWLTNRLPSWLSSWLRSCSQLAHLGSSRALYWHSSRLRSRHSDITTVRLEITQCGYARMWKPSELFQYRHIWEDRQMKHRDLSPF